MKCNELSSHLKYWTNHVTSELWRIYPLERRALLEAIGFTAPREPLKSERAAPIPGRPFKQAGFNQWMICSPWVITVPFVDSVTT